MRIKKQQLWRLHSWFGLVAGLGLLVIGLSGSILVFSKEIDGLLRPEKTRTEVPEPGERLPLERLFQTASSLSSKHEVTGWVIDTEEDPSATDQAWLKVIGEEKWEFVHIDPYTGEVLSSLAESNSYLTGWLLELHYTFLADHTGMLVAGVLGVMLLVLGITGTWLYRDFWKNFFRLRWGRSARIFFSDLHKMTGISSVVFNIILGFTGAFWNISHLAGHLAEEEAVPETVDRVEVEWASLQKMIERAPIEIEGFVTGYVFFARGDDPSVTLYGHPESAGPLRGEYGSTVTFSGKTGEVTHSADIREASLFLQIYDSFAPLHYGTFGGWPIRVLWCILGLAPGVLAVSGFLIWNSRRRKRGAAIS